MKHRSRDLVVAVAVALAFGMAGCDTPSDVIFEAPGFTPVEDRDGRFQVTFGAGPEVARGFLPDGRLVLRALDLPPFGDGWVLASVPPLGGTVREEVAVYRQALTDPPSGLMIGEQHRALVLWRDAVPGIHGCPDSIQQAGYLLNPANAVAVPPPASPVLISVYALPMEDGTALTSLPRRVVETKGVYGAGTANQRVRITPALRDADRTGGDVFGPALVPGTSEMVYSDGDELWFLSLADTSSPPVALGLGAYPSLGPDGRTLAFARPVGLDSVVQVYQVPLPIGTCTQEHVEISAAGWELVLLDLETGDERVLGDGFDPAFDPTADRIVARVGGALSWIDVGTGAATAIPGTAGAVDPSVSPDGVVLAFTLPVATGNTNVYFVRLVPE